MISSKTADEIGQLLRRDRRILHEGKRLRVSGDVHHQPQARLADRPDAGLVGGGRQSSDRIAEPREAHPPFEPIERRAQLSLRIPGGLHHHHGLGVSLDEVHQARVL